MSLPQFMSAPKKARAGLRRRGFCNPLQGAEEIEQVLLLTLAEVVEVVDDRVRLRRVVLRRAAALVLPDRFDQVLGPSVMQEEDALTQAPERGGAELGRSRLPLADAVRQ